jgi:hypothetical protein
MINAASSDTIRNIEPFPAGSKGWPRLMVSRREWLVPNRFRRFLQIVEAFNREGVEYVVVGGVAVNLQGIARSTEDIDVFVRMSPLNVDRLRKALTAVYEDPAIDEITLEELHNCSVLRYGTPDDFYIDILVKLGDFAVYEDVQSEEVEVENVKVRVATIQSLYWMKSGTLRPKDRQDAIILEQIIREETKDPDSRR